MATLKVDKTLAAFMDLIAWSEGTSTHPLTKDDGYDVIVSGVDGSHMCADYSTHPFALGRLPILVRKAREAEPAVMSPQLTKVLKPALPAAPAIYSTASGRYQIELATWEETKLKTGAGTFSPANQDIAALALIERRHAAAAILAGNIGEAISACCLEWASFPGNLYNQGGRKIDELLSNYERLLKAQSV